MTLLEMINKLNLTVLTKKKDFEKITPTTGYASDLLSCVMAGAQKKGVWVTLQSHNNIVAVAARSSLPKGRCRTPTRLPELMRKALRSWPQMILPIRSWANSGSWA